VAAIREAVQRHARTDRADRETAEVRRRAASLSRRERQVLDLIGALAQQAGRQRLGVTEKTIKVHRRRACHKMGARSLAELVLFSCQLSVVGGRQPAIGRSNPPGCSKPCELPHEVPGPLSWLMAAPDPTTTKVQCPAAAR